MLKEQDLVLVCFDLSNEDSFYEVSKLCSMLQQMQIVENIMKLVIIVGLKCDAKERAISYLDGERTAQSLNAPYIECSAKEDFNVEAVFDLVLT